RKSTLLVLLFISRSPQHSALLPYTTLFRSHLVGALEQGRLDVVTAGQVTLQTLGRTAGEHLRAFLLSDFEVAEDLVELLLRGLRSEEHTSELQSREHLVCRRRLETKNLNCM